MKNSERDLESKLNAASKAVATADAYLLNAGLPTYGDLRTALQGVMLHSPRLCKLRDREKDGHLTSENVVELAAYNEACSVLGKVPQGFEGFGKENGANMPSSRVLAVVTAGGVLETYADPGVDLVEFDWMNYLAESAEGRRQMALPARFADLAPDDIPIEDPAAPAPFIFKDSRPDGDDTLVEATFGYYHDGSPAIKLREHSTGEPYATCTVAWKNPAPAGAGADGKLQQTVWIRDYDEMAGITKLLVDAGILDRNWADAHSSMPGDPCPQLLTEKAMLALAQCERPKPKAIKKPAASLGM